MSVNQVKTFFTPKRVRVLRTMATGVVVPTIPVLLWWKWSSDQRSNKLEETQSKVRVPNVQTVDDLLIERCRPGDVLLFDRRWESCSAGPLAALSCLLSRAILCWEDQSKVVSAGKFDHCGR
jgi:hypothetical protein